MKKLFILNQEMPLFAREELLAQTDSKIIKEDENIIILETNKLNLKNILALTHEIWELIIEIPLSKNNNEELVEAALKKVEWNKYYKNNFLFRFFKKDKKHKTFNLTTKIIANKINQAINSQNIKTKISTTNPETFIQGICTDKSLFIGKFIAKTDKSYLERKPHLRLDPKPISIAPHIAKAMVNLLNAKENETILDPCCGTGGHLIEAGLLGKKIIGIDIDHVMIKITEKNLKYFNIKNYRLFSQDSLEFKEKVEFILTDLPYFKNTKGTKKESNLIYSKLIEHFFSITEKSICICLKKDIETETQIKKIANAQNWTLTNEFSFVVHKSMTRNIYLLKKIR